MGRWIPRHGGEIQGDCEERLSRTRGTASLPVSYAKVSSGKTAAKPLLTDSSFTGLVEATTTLSADDEELRKAVTRKREIRAQREREGGTKREREFLP
jgi:hypothetical protein